MYISFRSFECVCVCVVQTHAYVYLFVYFSTYKYMHDYGMVLQVLYIFIGFMPSDIYIFISSLGNRIEAVVSYIRNTYIDIEIGEKELCYHFTKMSIAYI